MFLNCIKNPRVLDVVCKNPRVLDVVCVSAHLLSAHAVGTPVAARASVKRHTGVECLAFNALTAIAPCVARKQGVTKHVTLRLCLATIATAKLPSPAAIPRSRLRLHCGLRRRCGIRSLSPSPAAAPSIRRGATSAAETVPHRALYCSWMFFFGKIKQTDAVSSLSCSAGTRKPDKKL